MASLIDCAADGAHPDHIVYDPIFAAVYRRIATNLECHTAHTPSVGPTPSVKDATTVGEFLDRGGETKDFLWDAARRHLVGEGADAYMRANGKRYKEPPKRAGRPKGSFNKAKVTND